MADLYGVPGLNPVMMTLLILWTIPWKGWALWRAARKNSLWWFVALIVINTAGILDILYIFVFSEMKAKKEK